MGGGRKKKFIDKKAATTYNVVHRSQQDGAFGLEDRPSERVLLAQAPVNAARRARVTRAGFADDGYDYERHLRAGGGGVFVGADGSVSKAAALPPEALPGEQELERAVEAVTLDDRLMDADGTRGTSHATVLGWDWDYLAPCHGEPVAGPAAKATLESIVVHILEPDADSKKLAKSDDSKRHSDSKLLVKANLAEIKALADFIEGELRRIGELWAKLVMMGEDLEDTKEALGEKSKFLQDIDDNGPKKRQDYERNPGVR